MCCLLCTSTGEEFGKVMDQTGERAGSLLRYSHKSVLLTLKMVVVVVVVVVVVIVVVVVVVVVVVIVVVVVVVVVVDVVGPDTATQLRQTVQLNSQWQ